LVLRSSKAKGEWSFRKPKHSAKITQIIEKFARKYGVRVISMANVGNHLHFHIRLTNRFGYKPFIRAITASITMAVTGASKLKPLKKAAKDKFWDYRPFTRIVDSFKAFLNLKDYVEINQWEGQGFSRERSRLFIVEKEFIRRGFWGTG
jgi:REP element-mobilizing transposase RayT